MPLGGEESDLVKRLLELPAVVREATERRGPHALPAYAIRVADDFHRFYHHHRVIDSDAEAFRLALCAGTTVVATCLDLLGIEHPNGCSVGGAEAAADERQSEPTSPS